MFQGLISGVVGLRESIFGERTNNHWVIELLRKRGIIRTTISSIFMVEKNSGRVQKSSGMKQFSRATTATVGMPSSTGFTLPSSKLSVLYWLQIAQKNTDST